MSMHKFQGLIQKNEDCRLFKALQELTDLESGDVIDLGWRPWN